MQLFDPVTGKFLGIDRSTWAGGISGLATWGIGLGLTALGVAVPPAAISGVVAIIIPVVVHFCPDAAKVDQEIKFIVSDLPAVQASYPTGKNGQTAVIAGNDSNINK